MYLCVCVCVLLGATYSVALTDVHTYSEEDGWTTSNTQQIDFTLNDRTKGDYFDIEVRRDPVYGTLAFWTLSGQSRCPHERNTDPRDSIALRMSTPFLANI